LVTGIESCRRAIPTGLSDAVAYNIVTYLTVAKNLKYSLDFQNNVIL